MAVLTKCKQSEKELVGDQCNLGNVKDLSTERFWNWSKEDNLDDNSDAYLGLDKCVKFDKEL